MSAVARLALLACCAAGGLAAAADFGPEYGRAEFVARRDPPAVRVLDEATRARFELGQLVYNTSWVAAGLPRAERRDGLGPLFNAASCDGCHNNGARGRAAARDGLVPGSFVMQLGGPLSDYGHLLNTSALDGLQPEGRIEITRIPRTGRYPDGTSWQLLEPRYRVTQTAYGALPATTVLRPRVGPALFGAGLLDAVPAEAVAALRSAQPRAQRGVVRGRFGWQADALSLQDQTEGALEREMGLTTARRPQDDCTTAQVACRAQPSGGAPEVSAEFLDAILTFQRELAVPRVRNGAPPDGARLFAVTGCAVCHRETLPTALQEGRATIRPYTDLLVHDMGKELADRRVDGRVETSLWRTAPLWGLGYELTRGVPALLHDGRAGSVEEAILWHGGQAAAARRRFMALPAAQRATLLAWLATL